jgi:hypothetical protein
LPPSVVTAYLNAVQIIELKEPFDYSRMVVIDFTIDGNHRYNWRKNSRSLFVKWTRPQNLALQRA